MRKDRRFRSPAAAVLGSLATIVLLSCSGSGAEADVPAIDDPGRPPRYTREFLFVGEREDKPFVVLFHFAATEEVEGVARSSRAWLAQDTLWDRFLDEQSSTSAGGVWRILPRPSLQVLTGGATGIQALVYRRDGRALKLHLDEKPSPWTRAPDRRFRAMEARVRLGARTIPGRLMETQRVERPHAPRYESSALLTDTAGTVIHVADAGARSQRGDDGFLWSWNGHSEPYLATGADIEPVGTRRLHPTGMEIPTRWRLRLSGSGIHGELAALGHEAVEEKERGGDGAVSVRYTVEGWIYDGTGRREVKGTMKALVR